MKRVLWQLVFWAVFFLVWEQLVYFYIDNPVNRALFTAFDTGLIMLSFYLLYSWLTPRLFQKGKNGAFVVGFVISVLVSAGLMFGVMQVFLRKGLVPIHFNFSWDYLSMQKNRFFIALLGAGTGFIAQLAMGWMQARRRMERAEKEKIASELTYLKAQVNPHFLFNSINTIYVQMSLSRDEARETLSIFSDMLRYQLYECTGESVSLAGEVEYLRNYIYLQRLRKDEHFHIEFAFEGEARGARIAPFLLIPFVENMFKHGSKTITGRFELAPGRLKFWGMNSKAPTGSAAGGASAGGGDAAATDGGDAAATGGIGLTNVRRRLDLLYPGRHTLEITDLPSTFEVCLDLRLP